MKSGYDISTSRLIARALRGALQVRLLMLFVAIALVPTTVIAFPVWRVWSNVLDYSPRASEFARAFDAIAFQDLWSATERSLPALGGASAVATLLAMFSWPLLAALAVTAARAERPLGIVALLQGGIARYVRMLRLGAVAIVPLSMAGGVAALVYSAARRHAESSILESQAKLGYRGALAVSLVTFVLLHATLEAGRGAIGADDQLLSGFRAWMRGAKLTLRAPLRVLAMYLSCTVVSYVVSAALLLVRMRMTGDTVLGFGAAFFVTQLSVAALGLGRAARLFGMTSLAQIQTPITLAGQATRTAEHAHSMHDLSGRDDVVARSG